jgi:hypothetical protein
MTLADEKTFTVEGIRVPDSSLACAITQVVRRMFVGDPRPDVKNPACVTGS